MAAKKRPPAKRGGSSPNTVLVIFLVFFILLAAGLGAGTYYGYEGQEKLRKTAKEEKDASNAARKGKEWGVYISQEYRQMWGDPFYKDDNVDEKLAFDASREDFFKPEGKYKEEKLKPFLEKSMEEAKKLLGWDDKAGKYLKTVKKLVQEKDTEIAALKGSAQKAGGDKTAAEDATRKLDDKYSPLHAQAKAENEAANKKAIEESKKRGEEFDKLLAQNTEVNRKLDEAREAYARLDREYKQFKIEVVAKGVGEVKADEPMEKKKPDAAVLASHALVLDISKAKTLWDAHVGKVRRVDARDRKVFIDRGSAHGVQPLLTFNVFGAGHDGKAEGPLKGTLEVMEVGETASVARITSMYDHQGQEIPLNVGVRGAAMREADSSMKEGDLLYNLTWGSRVAIAGSVNWSGFAATTPAEDMRHLQTFTGFLGKQGVAVDAHLDLTDAQIKGQGITPRTRFLILGARAVMPEKGKDGDEDPRAQAARAINEKIDLMTREAQDKGLLIMSHENFAYVIGYRPTRSAGEFVAGPYQPRQPWVGRGTVLKVGEENGGKMDKKVDEKMDKEKMDKEKEKEKEKEVK